MLISVITPAYQPRADYLAAAYDSLCAQQLPRGWEWEWLVQLDGDGALPLPARARADARVHAATGPHGGPGTARNLALERASGVLIRNLDADDVLTPTALADSIDVLSANSDVGWTACRALDLFDNGELVAFEGDPPEGRLQRGHVYRYWRSHDWLLDVHPTTLCIRRELLAAVGGWMALPVSEDTGMLLAISTLTDGWFIRSVGLHYRQHPGQITRIVRDPAAKQQRRNLLVERVEAMMALAATLNRAA